MTYASLTPFQPGYGLYHTTAAAAAAESLQSCLTVRPHRRQPTRLPRAWDSPGKNTGVGCQFLLQEWKWKVKVKSLSRVRLLATPWTASYQAPPSTDFPGKSTGVGCHCLLRSHHYRELFPKAEVYCVMHWTTECSSPRNWSFTIKTRSPSQLVYLCQPQRV